MLASVALGAACVGSLPRWAFGDAAGLSAGFVAPRCAFGAGSGLSAVWAGAAGFGAADAAGFLATTGTGLLHRPDGSEQSEPDYVWDNHLLRIS